MPHGYTGEPARLVTDVPPALGLTRPELVDGIAQTYRELQEIQQQIGDGEPSPAQDAEWTGLVERYRRYRAAVDAMDACPPD